MLEMSVFVKRVGRLRAKQGREQGHLLTVDRREQWTVCFCLTTNGICRTGTTTPEEITI